MPKQQQLSTFEAAKRCSSKVTLTVWTISHKIERALINELTSGSGCDAIEVIVEVSQVWETCLNGLD